MSRERSGGPLLSIEHLSVSLPTERGWVDILDDVSFEVAPGEMVGLAGESGSGKTMTALAILGLLPSQPRIEGSIRFGDVDLLSLPPHELRRYRGKEIAMIFQEPTTSLHPSWTIGEQIAESVRTHEHVDRKTAWDRTVEMLHLVDIPDPELRARQYAFQFSGGMQQRAMIAMALSCNPKLLIADEPTTALDVTVQAQIIELIKRLRDDRDMAVVFVTHDLGVLAGLTDRMIVMYGGQVAEMAETGDVFLAPRHPYTQALVLTAPHPDLKGQRLSTIPGVPPHPGALPDGCRFHPRCEYRTDLCTSGEILLEEPEPGRAVRCVRNADLQLGSDIERVRT